MLTEIALGDIEIGPRHRQDLGDLAGLVKSIREVGLLQPLVVTGERHLVAGLRRLQAVKELGWEKVPVHVVANLTDALLLLKAERDENICRKQFTPSEAVKIGTALEELERAEAAGRQKATQAPRTGAWTGKRKSASKSGPGKLPEPSAETVEQAPPPASPAEDPEPVQEEEKGQTRDKVGAAVGLSGRTYEKAKAVVAAAQEDPALAPLVQEMDQSGKVDRAYRELKKRQQQPEQAPAHPLSDAFLHWLDLTAGHIRVIHQEYQGQLRSLFAASGWDGQQNAQIQEKVQELARLVGWLKKAVDEAVRS
jgi:ParB-like chromosome segregation protein Spo0J